MSAWSETSHRNGLRSQALGVNLGLEGCRLMKFIVMLLVMVSWGGLASAAEPPPAPKITLFLNQSAGQSGLSVEIEFEGHSSGETTLFLPNAWGGQTELYRAIRDLTAENATLHDSANVPAERTLKHAPDAVIKLKYRLAGDAQGPPDKGGGNDYRVRLGPDLIFALGNAWAIKPSSVRQEGPVQLAIVTKPISLAFASDLEHQSPDRQLTFGDVVESALIAGNIRKIDAGGGARMAIFGKIDGRDDTGWRNAFTSIAGAQRKYWSAADEPFLVTALIGDPPEEGWTSVGGTGRTDAFAFFATTNASPARIDQILAHEMMHTWVPRRIGGMPSDLSEPLNYWLSEGFTDWASWRVLARSRFWRPKDFAAALNEHLKDYDLSPVREAPNDRILKDFWTDRSVGELPSRRGMLLGFYWDAKIRKATNGARDFDDVLLKMQDIAKAAGKTTAATLLPLAMREVANLSIGADLKTHVDAGKAVELAKHHFGLCGDLIWRDRPKFHRGFDIEATSKNGNIIVGVVKGGPAERAGLRDGMKLVKRSGGEIGNAQVEIAYDVLDGETPKTLRWMPEGQGREKFRQLKLADNLTGERETACLQRLGGI
jgi:predicted metalloprotease with PDZ domain